MRALMKENLYIADKGFDLSNTLQAKPKENLWVILAHKV